MAENSAIDLSKYTGEAGRFDLSEPWVRKGWTYATNGQICVRIPTDAPDTPTTDGGRRRPGAWEFFETFDAEACVNEVPATTGEMQSGWVECPQCELAGEGYCDKCQDQGFITGAVPVPVQVGVVRIAAKYIDQLHELPNVHCGKSLRVGEALPFVFEGGQGLLMPIVTQKGLG